MRTLVKVVLWLGALAVPALVGGTIGTAILSHTSSCSGQQCLAPAMAGFTFGGFFGALTGLIAMLAYDTRPSE